MPERGSKLPGEPRNQESSGLRPDLGRIANRAPIVRPPLFRRLSGWPPYRLARAGLLAKTVLARVQTARSRELSDSHKGRRGWAPSLPRGREHELALPPVRLSRLPANPRPVFLSADPQRGEPASHTRPSSPVDQPGLRINQRSLLAGPVPGPGDPRPQENTDRLSHVQEAPKPELHPVREHLGSEHPRKAETSPIRIQVPSPPLGAPKLATSVGPSARMPLVRRVGSLVKRNVADTFPHRLARRADHPETPRSEGSTIPKGGPRGGVAPSATETRGISRRLVDGIRTLARPLLALAQPQASLKEGYAQESDPLLRPKEPVLPKAVEQTVEGDVAPAVVVSHIPASPPALFREDFSRGKAQDRGRPVQGTSARKVPPRLGPWTAGRALARKAEKPHALKPRPLKLTHSLPVRLQRDIVQAEPLEVLLSLERSELPLAHAPSGYAARASDGVSAVQGRSSRPRSSSAGAGSGMEQIAPARLATVDSPLVQMAASSEVPSAPSAPSPNETPAPSMGRMSEAGTEQGVDTEAIARQVYQMLSRRLRVEEERARGWARR